MRNECEVRNFQKKSECVSYNCIKAQIITNTFVNLYNILIYYGLLWKRRKEMSCVLLIVRRMFRKIKKKEMK